MVGAGAFGGWTAFHLQRQGARVTLLDTWGPGNSRASSGGETRVIRGTYGAERTYVEMVVRAFELWRENERRWDRQLYRRTGALWMIASQEADDYATGSLPLQEEFGLPHRRLTPDEAARRWPHVDFDGVRWVLWEVEAGYLSARLGCQEVLRGFLAEGGEYRQLEVRPGELADGELRSVSLSDGDELAADAYVFACGPWLGRLFPDAIGERVLPTRQEVFYFGPGADDRPYTEAGGMPVWVCWGDALWYGIPGNRWRGFKVADDSRGITVDPTTMDRSPSPGALQAARRVLARRFPGLADAPLVESRVCQYENSPDTDFIIDRHPEAANLWLVGGGSGHGYKMGPAVGEHVAGLVLGTEPVRPPFSLERFDG